MQRRQKRFGTNSQRGMTLIELMIAMTILAVGLAALVGLIVTGVRSNTSNRLDTGATLAAQAVMETIAAQPGGTPVTLTDCAGNIINPVNTGGAAAGVSTGATLMGDNARIDFTAQTNAAVPAGYKTLYVACGPNGARVTYDVRWNIQTITQYSKVVTVGALSLGGVTELNNPGNVRYFNPPVNLRTIVATGN